MHEIKSHAEAAAIVRDKIGSNAKFTFEFLENLVGFDWANKMKCAGVVRQISLPNKQSWYVLSPIYRSN